jgi:hypothetical protein
MGALSDLISNPGVGGYEFEADLQGANYIPKSKLVYGPDGTATNVSTTDPWPTQLRNSTGTEIGTNANPVQVGDGGTTISVDDGAGSLTVDGTVAATQSGTWNVGTVTTVTNVVHVDDNASSLTVDDGGSTLSIDDGGGSVTVDGALSISGTVTASEVRAGTATRSDVSGTTSSTTLKAANANRLGIRICNDSSAVLYLLEGAGTASSSNFTTKLYQDELYVSNDFTGIVVGVWASATGAARVTELTA